VRSRERMMGGRALLVLLVSALLVQIRSSDPVSGSLEVTSSPVFVFGSVGAEFEIVYAGLQLLYESFDEDFKGRWTVSSKGDYQGTPAHLSPVSLFRSICARSVGFVAVFLVEVV
jgi:calnexin